MEERASTTKADSDQKRVPGFYSHPSFQGSDAEFQGQSCKQGWRLKGSYVVLADGLLGLSPDVSSKLTSTWKQEPDKGPGEPGGMSEVSGCRQSTLTIENK